MAFNIDLNQHSTAQQSSWPGTATWNMWQQKLAQGKAGQDCHDGTMPEAEGTRSWIVLITPLQWDGSSDSGLEAVSSGPSFFLHSKTKWEKENQAKNQKCLTNSLEHWVLLILPATLPPAIPISKDLPGHPSLLTPGQSLCGHTETELLWAAVVFELISNNHTLE